MSADEIMEDLKSKFSSICLEAGGTPKIEHRSEASFHYINFECNSAREFPNPKRFIELMKEASNLPEKLLGGSDIKLSFSVEEGTRNYTHFVGRIEYDPEGRYLPKERRYITWFLFERVAPYYRYKERMLKIEKELNASLDKVLGGKKGWEYECWTKSDYPHTVSLECKLIHNAQDRWDKPDLGRIWGILESFKDASE